MKQNLRKLIKDIFLDLIYMNKGRGRLSKRRRRRRRGGKKRSSQECKRRRGMKKSKKQKLKKSIKNSRKSLKQKS